MLEQKNFNVTIGIWTKENNLRPTHHAFNKNFNYDKHVLIGRAIEDMKFSVQVIVQLNPFARGCPFGFTEIIQLGTIRLSRFKQHRRAFLMFDGKDEALESANTEKIQEEFSKQLQQFLQRVGQLEDREAVGFREVASECSQRSSDIGMLRISLFN